MTYQEWIDWKNDPVTKEFMIACQYRIEDAMEELAISAGFNSNQDNMIRGMIKAYREIQEFKVDFEEEENIND